MLIQKLKAKAGVVALIGAPPEIRAQFSAFKPKTAIPPRAQDCFDFVLLFALQSADLNAAWKKVVPALKKDAVFWVAYPKKSSGIASDLAGMTVGGNAYQGFPWQPVAAVAIDRTWSGVRFKHAPGLATQRQDRPAENITDADGKLAVDRANRRIYPPADFAALLAQHAEANRYFAELSFTNRKEYVLWIIDAKKPETRAARLRSALEKLAAGKRNPSEK